MDTDKTYSCEICKKEYLSYMGLWRHNKKYHKKEEMINRTTACRFCNKELASKQSRWKHEQICKEGKTPLEEQVKQLTEIVKNLEKKPNITNNNNTTNTTNNTTNNIQYIINSPTASSIGHLTLEKQRDILDKELNALVYLIEVTNFNKLVPENHSYCVTAINDKHASVIDEKTNKIIKTNKIDLFDKLLDSNLNVLAQISSNPEFSYGERKKYGDKINYLRQIIFQNEKYMKRYQNDINIISYNNRDMVKETWKSLKDVNPIQPTEEPVYTVQGFDDLVDNTDFEQQIKTNSKYKPIIEIRSETSDSDSEVCEYGEIIIKGQPYILDGINVFVKNKKGTKDALYGTYLNGKIKKVSQPKEIEV